MTLPTSTCFVGSLHPRLTDAHLYKLFQKYGPVRNVFRCSHTEGPRRGQPKSYAFVEYCDIETAAIAIGKLDGVKLLGKCLVVRPAERKEKKKYSSTARTSIDLAK